MVYVVFTTKDSRLVCLLENAASDMYKGRDQDRLPEGKGYKEVGAAVLLRLKTNYLVTVHLP